MMQLCRLLSTAEISHGEAIQSAHGSSPDLAGDFTLSETGAEFRIVTVCRKGHGGKGGDLEEGNKTVQNASENDTWLHRFELLQLSISLEFSF